MAFWIDKDWIDASPPVVEPFDDASIDDGKYKLSIGPEIYVSTQQDRNTIRQLSKGEAFTVRPGEFCFILTDERIKIPFDALGFISMSTKIKFYGLVNVSGFHVDPGYIGRLIFAVFNSGPKTVHLTQGQRIFSLWLARLSAPNATVEKIGYDKIDPEVVNQLEGNFLTAYQLSEKISKLDQEIQSQRNRISDLESNWKKVWLYAGIAIAVFIFLFRATIMENVNQLFSVHATQEIATNELPSTQSNVPKEESGASSQ